MGLLDRLIGTKEERTQRATARAAAREEEERKAASAREEARRELVKIAMESAESDPVYKEQLAEAVAAQEVRKWDPRDTALVANGMKRTFSWRNEEIAVNRRIQRHACFRVFESMDVSDIRRVAAGEPPTTFVFGERIIANPEMQSAAIAYARKLAKEGYPRLLQLIGRVAIEKDSSGDEAE